MNTIEYISAIKTRRGIESDYALAKALNVSKQTVSRYVQGKGFFDDDVALRVAELANVPSWKVLLDMHVERSKTPEVKAAWSGLMEKISESFRNLLPGGSPRQYSL